MEIWQAQSIQFVWFITSADTVKADVWFSAFAGEDPDNVQRNKTIGPAMPFLSIASGVVGGKQYSVQVQPGRIDLHISAVAWDGDTPPSKAPGLDLISETKTFLASLEASDLSIPPCIRLAMVANLWKPTENEDQAASLFFESLGVDIGLNQVSDAIFQVNRRKKMKSVDMQMNRVIRFQVASFQDFVFQITPGIGGPGQAIPIATQKFAAQRTYDLNNAPGAATIEEGKVISIFREMADEIFRLAQVANLKALMD